METIAKRPEEITREQVLVIANKIAKEIQSWGTKWTMFQNNKEILVEHLLEVIEEYSSWDNGYEMAKKLEDNHNWQPDSTLVEILDNIGHEYDQELEKCVREWVKASSIKPTRSEGDAVKIRINGHVVEGKITSIDTSKAIYYVKTPDLKDGSAYLIEYEDIID